MPRLKPEQLPAPDKDGNYDLRHTKGSLSQGGPQWAIVKPRTHKQEIERIRKAVRNLGGHLWVAHQSARLHGAAGIPDLIVALPFHRPSRPYQTKCWLPRIEDAPPTWRTCFLEVKVGRDKLSPAQEHFIRVMRNCGQTVLVGGLDELLVWREGAP